MRKFIALALVTGLVAAPAAIAGKDASKPVAPKVKYSMFEFSGTVTAVGTDSITISPVRAHGKKSRVALAGATSFVAKIDGKTRLLRSGMGRVALGKVMVGDRVKVEVRAPRGTTLAEMPAAKRVKVKSAELPAPVEGPAPAPAPAPEPVPTPAPIGGSNQDAPLPPPILGF